jgi:predicted dinucleotide-binding enzyme
MNIGIIGAGMIGETLARRLAQLGHQIAIANSRGPQTLRDLAVGGRGHRRDGTRGGAAAKLWSSPFPNGRCQTCRGIFLRASQLRSS